MMKVANMTRFLDIAKHKAECIRIALMQPDAATPDAALLLAQLTSADKNQREAAKSSVRRLTDQGRTLLVKAAEPDPPEKES